MHNLNLIADRYRIEREIGAGGMATVYLAHDIRHEREVAIKVLHPDLGAVLGAERFLAEIRTTARLQHPHILPLLDSGAADGLLYYVMPLVTGETLRSRLERERQLPIDDAVRIAREVADALGYAHGRNVIHRDIKPENILLQDGHAVVADFGIALAVQSAGGSRMTQTGLSLGTPQYMSPEQAMGERTIDARSDVYALGAVTYEMLAGEPPFSGATVQAIVAKVMTERPTSLHTIRDTVPANVEHAVFKALAKLPADRFATTTEFSAALTSEGRDGRRETRDVPGRPTSYISRLTSFLFFSALIIVALLGWLRRRPTEPVLRVAVLFPPGQELRPQYFGFSFALSHDGSRLAYIGPGVDAAGAQLWIRPLDGLSATPVPGTAGIYTVEWSPDDRLILFGANSIGGPENFVVPANGGEVTRLANVREATWGSDGAIYFFPRGGKGILARQQIGGRTDTVRKVVIDSSYADRPLTMLPGNQGALFAPPLANPDDTAGMRIEGLSFGNGARTTVGAGLFAWYLPDAGLLRVAADGSVFLEPFDPGRQRITGASVPVARVAVGSNSGDRYYPQISVASNGTMAYLSGVLLNEQLRWIDAGGNAAQATDISGNLWGFSISPDGSQVAFSVNGRVGAGNGAGPFDIWVENLKTGARTRLTTASRNMRPSWSPDGKYVLWSRIGGDIRQGMIERRADASEPERMVLSRAQFGHSVADARWLPDHRTLLVSTYVDSPNGRDIYAITPGQDSVARPLAVMAGNQSGAISSPDGTVVAYSSDESGVRELYVQPLASGAGRLKVSDGGSSSGRWSRDGRTLYYWNQRSELVAASIQVKPTLLVTATHRVAAGHVLATGGGQNAGLFDIAPDGRALVGEDLPGTFQLILVRNWKAGLAKSGQ